MSNYSLPLFMQVKANAVTDLNKNLNLYMPKLVFAKTLILTTEGLLQTLDRKVKILLNQLRGYEIVTVKESSFDFAVEVAKKVAMNNIRLVIGLGGGTALDTAKYAAFVANVAYIAIPTALSNDGVCSPVSVLLAQNGRRHSFTSKIPDGLLIDTDIIFEAPRLLLKAGVGDTISNYTALYDWQLGCDENNDRPNDFAYMLSETAFNSLLYSEEKSLTSIPGIKMLAQSLVLSGLSMQLAGNSRPCSGSEHLFSHAMDELFDHNIPHGILVGMGSVVSCKLQGRDHHVVLDFLKAYDISVNPAKLGITEDMFIKAWMFAKEVRKERYTILNKINLTEELFRQLYVAMLDECE
ncbi:iron-containing alcohol dehydrogenase family protein [Phascolarctobacterium sp. ET69]|uniref:iron-containing alcohol dehydrogenase family protein n=1 Tax=Phascolarctobacterium sp. ET69 TaxID=2939420 RepID=UPI00033E07F9|nr:iron-containing alcohol dehydrogenase family protein [Phascolarctobacterium sp. ET69]MCL1604896.1 iron-containing alcohol dehydrogenase family protein [Phascolarctobacterium sp. ET69]CDB35346.1 3-dehydroquinate synthase [Phascolarctobacterium sp. CAG:266]